MKRLMMRLLPCLLLVSGSVMANGLASCEDLGSFASEPVITIDFEGLTEVPGADGAYALMGDEYSDDGLTLYALTGELWAGIPDASLGGNSVSFFAADFIPVSGEAVFSPDHDNSPGSPTGTVRVNFSDPVSAVALYFLDAEGAESSITAFDDVDNELGTAIAQNEGDNSQAFKYVLSADQEIYSVVIQLGNGGDGVGMDDLCFIDPDSDDDGVLNIDDLCSDTPQTDPTVPSVRLGTNRWIWEEGDWVTNAKGVEKDFTIEQTRGCSCEQILDELVLITDLEFDGHYKFGCSQSVVEDWISGLYYLESLEVPSYSEINTVPVTVESETILKSSETYQLVASGVADAGDTILFDAKYSVTQKLGESPDTPADWTDDVSGYESYGTSLLELLVDGATVDWGPYNADHTYIYPMVGQDQAVELWIYDIYHSNNVGNLDVDIFVELW
jgi:hypothetical protein